MKGIIKRWRQKRIAKEMRKIELIAFNNELKAEQIKRRQAEEFASYGPGYYGPGCVKSAETTSPSLIQQRVCPMCGGKLK